MYESGEDYLEAILMIWNEKNECHAVDIAHKLNVTKPSVSRAMGILKEDGFVFVDEFQHINLTEKGRIKAQDIYNRHELLTAFLQKITGISAEQAEQNACRVEHVIDSDVVRGIQDWMAKN
ncbi:MAG: metal-dependent transcriptional regulator [Treponema sp.]|nr:metal-dependent transcriptional regulator [Treponema sp.]